MKIGPSIAEKATKPLSASPRSFLKWAGSKRFLLRHIVKYLPKQFGTYYEPFLGSGSLFFILTPSKAVLGDSCEELIDTYAAVKDNPRRVLSYLKDWRPDPELFYRMRSNRSFGKYKRAAQFIYLNKTCWNGLYRVNLEGQFNVPYGRPKTDYMIEKDELLAAAKALRRRGVSLVKGDFAEALDSAERGDFVYLDPPYVTGHNGNGFLEYNRNIFSWDDQKRLADTARQLAKRGVFVLVSNANHQPVLDLYRGFELAVINRTSTLASDLKRRRAVSEALLYSIQN